MAYNEKNSTVYIDKYLTDMALENIGFDLMWLEADDIWLILNVAEEYEAGEATLEDLKEVMLEIKNEGWEGDLA